MLNRLLSRPIKSNARLALYSVATIDVDCISSNSSRLSRLPLERRLHYIDAIADSLGDASFVRFAPQKFREEIYK